MDKRSLLFITLLMMSCAIFSQKSETAIPSNSNLRPEKIESIVSFNGDFTIADMKQLRNDLPQIGVQYLGYCSDQKCMIVSVVKQDENTASYMLEKIKGLAPGKVMGFKDYPIDEYAKSCIFLEISEAQFFKNRIQQ